MYTDLHDDLEDIIECIIIITIIRMIMDGSINVLEVIKQGTILGIILNIIKEIYPKLHIRIKEGLQNSVGYFIFSKLNK